MRLSVCPVCLSARHAPPRTIFREFSLKSYYIYRKYVLYVLKQHIKFSAWPVTYHGHSGQQNNKAGQFSDIFWRTDRNASQEWPRNLITNKLLTTPELIQFSSRYVHFPYFRGILTKWNRSNLGFPGIFRRTRSRNSLQIDMLMYSGHLEMISFDFPCFGGILT